VSTTGGIVDCHVHPTAAKGEGPTACAAVMLRFADRMGIEWLGTSLGPSFFPEPTEAEIEADNDFNAELIALHPNVDAICERAAELNAPILQHTFFRTGGNRAGESSPDDLARLAARHREVTFIAAHAGLNWERGIRAVAEEPNVLVDTCGFDPEMGFTEMAVQWLGAGRVVYGSDAAGRSFASQLAKVHGADISADDRQRILSGNMRRVLDL
jgi:predicted TIM-barrel fold metal-dependent hydrolase